jgi:hypothetical protein
MLLGALVGGPIGLLIALGGGLGSAVGAHTQQARVRELLKPNCATSGPAVAYRGWDGDAEAFTFANRQYAEEFRQANAARLVA